MGESWRGCVLIWNLRKCRCSPSAVEYTLQKYRLTNSYKDKPGSGRPRVSSARNDRILIRMCRENCRMTSQELQQQSVRGRLLDCDCVKFKGCQKTFFYHCVLTKAYV
uniref:Uncharacterized protein n=1 Tax=Amphiprion percula TaxID=161767 RepID=A0A3P8T4D7_AMPPE